MKEDPRKDQLSEVQSSYRVDLSETEQAESPNGHSRDELVSEAGKWVSEEEYWEHYFHHPDFNYEWNNGILEEKPVSDIATVTVFYWFLTVLYAYLETNPIAKVGLLEFATRLPLPHKTAIRKPDLTLVLNDNALPLADLDRSYRGVCDLAIEALSDSSRREKERDQVVKYAEYEGMGIREYFILHTDEDNMGFYRLNNEGQYESIPPSPGGVIVSEVLPGFQFRVADLLRQPTLFEMSNDPIYQEFVFPHYAIAKKQFEAERQYMEQRLEAERRRLDEVQQRVEEQRQRAEHEQQRAEEERQRAEHEQQRAEEERQRAEHEQQRAEEERQRAEHEQQRAEEERQRAEHERQRAKQERQRAERLAARLRELGISEDDL